MCAELGRSADLSVPCLLAQLRTAAHVRSAAFPAGSSVVHHDPADQIARQRYGIDRKLRSIEAAQTTAGLRLHRPTLKARVRCEQAIRFGQGAAS
jgi:hypothetical protein